MLTGQRPVSPSPRGATDGTRDRRVEASVALLDRLFPPRRREFDVRFWDGTLLRAEGLRRFTLHLTHPGSLRRMFASLDELSLGEAYIYGDCDVEGPIEAVGPVIDKLLASAPGPIEKLRLLAALWSLPADGAPRTGLQPARFRAPLHSRRRDREAIQYHYDVSNAFYELWLDRRMVYSCAYFADGNEDLDTAQERKLDYVCRKLRLKPGERLFDIGCGWGALLIHAATRYGARACGVTLSERQYERARREVERAGVGERCEVRLIDFRDVDEAGAYDKVASIGMFEHVGGSLLQDYFARAWRLLRPGGVFLNHGVGRGTAGQARRGRLFSSHFGFPDSDIVPLGQTIAAATAAGFYVRDVESLREHYTLTLRHWVRRMAERYTEAVRATDETTFRAWQLVLSGGAHGFSTGTLDVWQTLLHKPGGADLPLTRDDWYL